MRSVRSPHGASTPIDQQNHILPDPATDYRPIRFRLGTTPQHTPLFEDLARYTSSLLARTATATATTTTLPIVPPPNDAPAAKKRKIQNGDLGPAVQAPVDVKSNDATAQFYIQDVSFAIPQRKKFTLEVTAGQSVLRARNQVTKEIDFGVPMDRIRECHFWLLIGIFPLEM